MIHEMKLKPEPFNSIKSGRKTVEMRLNDQKRSAIKKDDFICFTNVQTGEKIYTLVKDKAVFNSFDQLYKNFDKIALGYDKNQVANPSDMQIYYPQEEIEKYGVVAIVIELITRKLEE